MATLTTSWPMSGYGLRLRFPAQFVKTQIGSSSKATLSNVVAMKISACYSENPPGGHANIRKWTSQRRFQSPEQWLASPGSFHPAGATSESSSRDLDCSSNIPADQILSKELVDSGREGFWTVIIPTYNRLPILRKCLAALEDQRDYRHAGIQSYEVLVVDDGSTDGTVEFLLAYEAEISKEFSHAAEFRHEHFDRNHLNLSPKQSTRFPHVRVLQQLHQGAGKARNLGFVYAQGSVVVFIDSDLVVTQNFLKAHGEALKDAFEEYGNDRAFTYGRVINTNNFEDPQSEPFKLTDYSAAFFATGNVAISRRQLAEAAKMLESVADGPFDTSFSEYGWEDLELGERLRQRGARIKHAPAAIGYHWHPVFTYEQLQLLIEKERQRGRNGVQFYQKHPNLNVRLMIQMTPLHEGLWFLLTAGGLVNEKTMEPLLHMLLGCGQNGLALALVSPILNWHTVQAAKEEAKRLKCQ